MLRRGLRNLERRSVLLHTRDGQSFKGVLLGVYADSVAVGHAVTWNGDREVELGGEVWVDRSNVSFFQTITPGEAQRDHSRDR